MRPRWRPKMRRGFAGVRTRYPAPRRGAELHKRSAEASGETRSKTLSAPGGVAHRFATNRGSHVRGQVRKDRGVHGTFSREGHK